MFWKALPDDVDVCIEAGSNLRTSQFLTIAMTSNTQTTNWFQRIWNSPVSEHDNEHSSEGNAGYDCNDNTSDGASSHAWSARRVDSVVLCRLCRVVGWSFCCRLVWLGWMLGWMVGWRVGRSTGWLWKFASHANVTLQVGAVGVVPLGSHVVSLHTVLAVFALEKKR